MAVVEFARNVCGLKADSIETNPDSENLVIDILPEQKNVSQKGGTMRLGAYKAVLSDSKVRKIYGSDAVFERHRHRYEVNPKYHEVLQDNGLVFSGMSEDGRLVEFIELPNHSFFIGTQSHPEFKSNLLSPSPLFNSFVEACLNMKEEQGGEDSVEGISEEARVEKS